MQEKTMETRSHSLLINRLKCLIVGDSSVGKTCILCSYVDDKFQEDYIPTVFDNINTNIKVDSRNYILNLWDTAGQEDYSQLRRLSYSGTNIFIIVFSVICPASFENVKNIWIPEVESICPESYKIIIGNKIDLRQEDKIKEGKHISYQLAKETFINLGFKYLECSALTHEGLETVFLESVRVCSRKNEVLLKENNGFSCFCGFFERKKPRTTISN